MPRISCLGYSKPEGIRKLVGVITRESLEPRQCGITIWRSIPRDYIVLGETVQLSVLLIEA